MAPDRFSKDNPWEYIDNACWRGELLHLGQELSIANLAGDDGTVIDLIFRAESGNLDGSDPKYGQLVERLGVAGPGAHSARAALGYARMSFFVGQWQNVWMHCNRLRSRRYGIAMLICRHCGD